MLSPTKKADRAKMAEAIKLLAAELGARSEITDETNHREIHAIVCCDRGLNASFTISATGQNVRDNIYVIAWYMNHNSNEKLSTDFECAIGHLNRHHRQKATSVVRGFDLVLSKLQIGIKMARDGRAFHKPEKNT